MDKKLFWKAFKTLLWSWGGDTPPEAIWTANELLDFFEASTGIKINGRLEEDSDNDEVLEIIKQLELKAEGGGD